MKTPKRLRQIIQLLCLWLFTSLSPALVAQPLQHFKVGWTTYAGWMPWAYAVHAGIIKRWARRYRIDITMVRFDDYLKSIRQYMDEQLDVCAMTNVEAMSMPASHGIDSTAFLPTDYSNGADGIVLRGGKSLQAIRGAQVVLVPHSVSQYLLDRALSTLKLDESDVRIVPVSDADIASVFSSGKYRAGAFWYPQLHEVHHLPGVAEVFDSSQIPGEIQDLLLARTGTLTRHPELAMALTGAWYETMNILRRGDKQSQEALCYMGAADANGCGAEEFRKELATVHLYRTPHEALKAWQSKAFRHTTRFIREFAYRQGVFGKQVAGPDDIGIAFPDGSVIGSRANITLRFSTAFTTLAAQRLLLP